MGLHDGGEVMRALISASLKTAFDPAIVDDLLDSYEKLVGEYRKSDPEATLNAAGKFVEHLLRAIEGVRTGLAPQEIKSIAATVKSIEADTKIPEPLRLLIPRIASAAVYDVRSKRGAAHVKGIDPRHIDASLAVNATSWILAELLRLYHAADEGAVAAAMVALVQDNLPLVEQFDDELIATTPMHAETEVLLMVSAAEPKGSDRRGLGIRVKHPPPAVTRAVQSLEKRRHIHKTKAGLFRMTGPGEHSLVERLAALGRPAAPSATRARR